MADLGGGAPADTATAAVTDGSDGAAEPFLRDAWWGRDGRLYATMSSSICDPSGGVPMMPPSLWRLDGTRWVSVDGGPLLAVRQVGAALKAVVTGDGTLYSELRGGAGVRIAADVRSIAAPPGPDDPAAAPAGEPRGPAYGPCLSRAEFERAADAQASTVFEGSPVDLTVTGAVTCQAGQAYAPVRGYDAIGWVVLRYQERRWTWALDPYWRQYGDDPCGAVPARIRARMSC
ncbi:hypothetical protein [Spirilliplanes yamanashiensis]|uniref:Uncharacterized protein n=1 Tax=Spirilliplanes yamanashiensis TaxID=42233 RepID=A0A8J3Y607_9ACTN|nr:hypothetical protein [Spirilliplanes yamanashiensis]MDP9814827.1 hypothetical protein [Spirilliplanes yamanashiensis]GIJ02481.1 hypothetical protein Sya03_18330 [Spirilliplanes yamanashiensis]